LQIANNDAWNSAAYSLKQLGLALYLKIHYITRRNGLLARFFGFYTNEFDPGWTTSWPWVT